MAKERPGRRAGAPDADLSAGPGAVGGRKLRLPLPLYRGQLVVRRPRRPGAGQRPVGARTGAWLGGGTSADTALGGTAAPV